MDWHLAVGAKYFRLLDDAQDSPVVDNRGERDQWIAGLGFAYGW